MTFQDTNSEKPAASQHAPSHIKSLRDYTREIMAQGIAPRAAVEFLVRLAESDILLRDALVRKGAEQEVRTFFSDSRRSDIAMPVVRAPQIVDPAELAERQEIKMQRRLFWDRYALFGQLQLRYAKRPDLRQSIDSRKIQAAGNLRCAKFEDAILRRMKNDKVSVERSFTLSKIVELAKEHHVLS